MKVGVLLYPFGEKHPAGLGAYVLNLTIELIKQRKDWHFYLFTKGTYDTSIFDAFSNVTVRPIGNHFLWKDVAYIRNRYVDVWIYNNPNMPLLCTPKRSIVTALDFGTLYPNTEANVRDTVKQVVLKYFQHIALKRTSHVACTSFATKKDLHIFFPDISEQKVTVIMCGFTKICEVYSEDKNLSISGAYYLLIGVIKPRKNQLSAIQAFILAKEKGLKGKLVVCGKGSGEYFDSVMETIHSSKYADDILYLGYRTNEEMVTLFRGARALIFPSLLEGFGMPILEAMSCGTPVITSSNGAIGEAAGEAALTVASPYDVQGFSEALMTLQDDEIRSTYIKKGDQRASEFSWEKSARGYIAILENLIP